MDNCPFCGAPEVLVLGATWSCYSSKNRWGVERSSRCYKNQLSQQADLLRQALDVVTKTANAKQLSQCHDEGNVFVLHAGTKTKAQSLIPAIEAAVKDTK